MKNFLIFSFFIFLSFGCKKEIIQFSLTTTVNPLNSGTISPSSGTFETGQKITLTATPAGEYIFKNWEGGLTGSNNPSELLINSDKNVSGVFEKRPYPLNLTIEGSGTVSEEIVTVTNNSIYPSGTIVKLTAIPNEGWSFFGWLGDINGSDNIKQITIDKETKIIARFEENLIYSKITDVDIIYPEVSSEALTNNIYHFPAKVHISSNGTEYLIHNPSAKLKENNTFEYVGPIQLIKKDDEWQFDKIYKDIKIGNSRNTHIINNESYLVASAPELPGGIGIPDQNYWATMIDGTLNWKKINSDLRWSHDISGGDLNGDGLLDVACASPLTLYTQNEDGTFTKRNDLYSWKNERIMGFAVEIADVYGDDTPEIISGGYYGSGNPLQKNNIAIYTFNKESGEFELLFDNKIPNLFFEYDLGATSIEVHDFNNDGRNDIAVARESSFNGPPQRGIEIWKNEGDGTFTFMDKILYNQDELDFTEFMCKDINNDGNIDILLNGNGGGDLLRIKNEQGGWIKFKLNNLIQINDGQGNFSPYSKDSLEVDFAPDYLYPYISNNKLHFFGSHTKENISSGIRVTYWNVKVNIY